MIGFIFSTLLIAHGQKNGQFLRYADSNFVISTSMNGPAKERIPLSSDSGNSLQSLEFRRDQVFVVWDDRGLTVRNGKISSSTHFKSVPTSPRLRTRDEILKTINDRQNQNLSFQASSLSGCVRAGNHVYGIVRWTKDSDKTWLECLFDVNLSSPKPVAHALSILPGTSFAQGFIDHVLFLNHGSIAAYIKMKNQWGKWDYNPSNGNSTFQPIGNRPVAINPYPNHEVGFIEKSTIGTYYAGVFDPKQMSRVDVQEFDSKPQFLNSVWPPVVSVTQRGLPTLVNLEQGNALFLAKGCQAKEGQAGVIVWTGMSNPKKAWLFSVENWKPMAWWSKPS